MHAIHRTLQVTMAVPTIAFIEVILEGNHIDFSGTSITSSGQLSPHLVGALSLLNVCLVYLLRKVGKVGKSALLEGYVAFLSNMTKRIERLIKNGQGKQNPNGYDLMAKQYDHDPNISSHHDDHDESLAESQGEVVG